MIALILTTWLICGLLAGLAYYRYFQSEYPSFAKDQRGGGITLAVVWSFLGPLALTFSVFQGEFKHGINPFRKP